MSYRRKHIQPKIKKLKPKKKLIQKPPFWIFLSVLVLIGAVFYFILLFPKFHISYVKISGNEKITNKEVENAVWTYLDKKLFDAGFFAVSSKSIFIVSNKKIIDNILNKFSAIEEVFVKREFPNSISLAIKEREPFAVFCSDYIANPRLQVNRDQSSNCFYIDKNGIMFEPVQDIPQDMIVITSGHKEFSVGETVIQKDIADIISKVSGNLKNNFQITVKEVFASAILILRTSENWQIHFDPNSDVDLQIVKMNSLLENEISADERKNLQYIYLQYKDRAYYK